MGWVMSTGIFREWVEVLLTSSKILSQLKILASKILRYVNIGQVSISIPSIFVLYFREEIKSSPCYSFGQWFLSQSWRIFELQKCAILSLKYCLDSSSTSHIIWFGLCTTARLYHRSSCPNVAPWKYIHHIW